MSAINQEIIQVGDLFFAKYIDAVDIEQKVEDIALQLNVDYNDKYPLMMVVMNGAFVFAADLIRKCNFPCELNFVRIKSYHGTESTGKIDIHMPSNIQLEGRHIIIIEDIIDTGNTMAKFIPELWQSKPASIQLASILLKPEAHQHDITTKYAGYEIPNKFVVGYGLDYNGMGRNLKHIYQLHQ